MTQRGELFCDRAPRLQALVERLRAGDELHRQAATEIELMFLDQCGVLLSDKPAVEQAVRMFTPAAKS